MEGYEHKVLKGAKETILKYNPLLFLEIHGHLLNLYNATIMDVYGILKDYKYTIYDIHDKEIKDEEQYNNLFSQRQEIRVICRR